jgi:Tn3 transposase DDE domain
MNAIILSNTRYMERALRQLQQQGLDPRPEDVERLSPLVFQDINLYLDIFGRGACSAKAPGSAETVGSARSSHRRRLMAVCRSTSRGQPRSTASSTSCSAR